MTLEEILKTDPKAVEYVQSILKWRTWIDHHAVEDFYKYMVEKYDTDFEAYC